MNDDNSPTQGKKNVAVALIPSVILAVVAAVGWYLYLTLHQEHEAMIGNIKVQIGNFESRVAQLEQDRDSLAASLDYERQTREQVQDSLASQRDSLAALKSTLAAEQASAAELQADLERARDERRQLENDLQQEVERLATNSSDLEQALAQHQAQQESLQQRIEAASAEKEQLGRQLEEAQARREELQDQIAKVNAEVAAKEAEVVAKEAEVAAKEVEIAMKETEIAAKDQEITAKEREIATKEAALATARDNITALNGQLAQSREEKILLEARLVDLSEQQKKEAAHFALLQSRLEQELDEHRVEITQLKNRMTVINLTSEVLFDSGSIEIKPAGRRVLDLIAESLNAYPEREISIDGHTDNVPVGKASRYVSNWDLSTTRAIAAVDHLQRAGVLPRRLRAVGHGEHKPIASNANAEGRQLNRRIEIRLLPEFDETS